MEDKPTPYPRMNGPVTAYDPQEWYLDSDDPFERAIMEIVRMHRRVLDSHERRFEAAIEHLKNVR